jgi:hypothetical protein
LDAVWYQMLTSKADWSWGCVSAIDSNGRTIWIIDAHRDEKRFVVPGDEKLTAFLELERSLVRMEVRRENLRQNQAAKAN